MPDLAEIYRYMGIKPEAVSENMKDMILSVAEEADKISEYKTVSLYYDIKNEAEGVLDLGFSRVSSKALKKNLSGCKKILIFAATLGMGFERKLAFYSESSPFKALAFQAAGTELLERKTDEFLKKKAQKEKICFGPRFSPGYGDLPLSLQKDIFVALKPDKYIGVYLSKAYIMIPSKSITAIAGVLDGGEAAEDKNKCKLCKNINCRYRKED